MENYAHLFLGSSSNGDHNVNIIVLDKTNSESITECEPLDAGFAVVNCFGNEDTDSDDLVYFDAITSSEENNFLHKSLTVCEDNECKESSCDNEEEPDLKAACRH